MFIPQHSDILDSCARLKSEKFLQVLFPFIIYDQESELVVGRNNIWLCGGMADASVCEMWDTVWLDCTARQIISEKHT